MASGRTRGVSPTLAAVLGLGALAGIGFIVVVVLAVWKMGPGYHSEANEVERLAREIPGVEVVEVDGNHDLTLEDIWLDLTYRGERFLFTNVTPASFHRVDHVFVGQVGKWRFAVRGFRKGQTPPPEETLLGQGAEVQCYTYGGTLDFGPAGNAGPRFDPPIRSIPQFLERLPEVRQIVQDLPDEYPGRRLGESEHCVTMMATGKEKRTPLWLWVERVSAD